MKQVAELVSRETVERLEAYADILKIWSRRLNLIAPGDLPSIWPRHILDSLQLGPLIDRSASSAIDLGSGAGFPGLMLAIATHLHFHLVESDQRKAAFLREAARITAAPVTIHAARVESLELAPTFLITARALAPLDRLLPLAFPFLASGGQCLFLKGAHAQRELDEARQHWHMIVTRHQSRTSPDATILEIRDLRRA